MYIYTPEDYIGELNLIALERRIIIRELLKTQRMNKAADLLKFTSDGLRNKLRAHSINKHEWQR